MQAFVETDIHEGLIYVAMSQIRLWSRNLDKIPTPRSGTRPARRRPRAARHAPPREPR